MNLRTLHRASAAAVFLVSIITYAITVSPTVVFWDVGEFCAAAFSLQVPHPPGAPLFLLIARVFAMVPFVHDIAVRMHIISALGSAMGSMFLYLITVRFIKMWRGESQSLFDLIAVSGSAIVGALSLTFNKTYWFNAVEAEVYGASMLLVSLMIWLSLRWYERADRPRADVYLLFIAYLIGLSVGVHLLAILALFTVMLLVYFRLYDFSVSGFVKFGVVAMMIFGMVYPVVVKEIPSMLDGEIGGEKSEFFSYLPFIAVGGALYGVWYSIQNNKRILNVAMLSFLLIVLGYSTYIMVYIRANANPPMNENNPGTVAKLVSYLNREQYGSAPLIQRRWDTDPEKRQNHQKYTSDFDYFWRYQFGHMFIRYIGWNYVGSAGDEKEAGVDFKQLYAIPLLLSIFGVYYHWKKDPKMAFVGIATFLVMGVVLVFYFNMQESQPRERDYFYVGAFMMMCMWIGLGVLGVIDLLKENLSGKNYEYASYGMLAFGLIFVDVNMARVNFREANRAGNYIPWDYSYNLLQSCEQDAILFTNGDNDTFPLWYLQDVEGVRQDIRIVNLSLLNTPWYIKQLKHNEPYGAKKVALSATDEFIERVGPSEFNGRDMELPVPPEFTNRFVVENPGIQLDTTITRGGVIRFYMPHSMEVGKIKAIRVQDMMVWDILRSAEWRRPIYFAMTVADDGKIGLREYMQLSGLAFKFVPVRNGSYWANMDEKKIRASIFTNLNEPTTTPHEGFLWRGLQNPKTYFDEDARRLITSNYRNVFMALSLYYANVKNEPSRVSEVLNRMEEVIPRSVIPMDFRVKYDIASFYSTAGNKSKQSEYLNEVVSELTPVVARGVNEQLSQNNPYIVLFYAYAALERWKEAEELLAVVKSSYPTQQGIDGLIAQLRSQLRPPAAQPAQSLAPESKGK
jgi:hypothetical protein